MLKIGVIHYNWPNFSFDEFLRFAAESGYGYVELTLGDVWPDHNLNGDAGEMRAAAKRVRDKVEAHGLKVSAFGAGNDFVQLEESAIQFEVERMRRVCELTRILGDSAVVRTEGGAPKDEVPPEKHWDAMGECFSRCTPFLDEMQVGLAVDNHGLITNEGDPFFAMLQKINHPLVGANLDTMNFRWWGNEIEDCNRFYELLAPHALHVHLKDGFDSRDDYKGAALGEGEIVLQHALTCLKNAGYDGVYTAEYEGPEAEGGVGYRKCAQWMQANL